MNPRFAWPAVILVSIAMLIVGGMAVAKVDRETIIMVVGLLVSPAVSALVSAQVADVKTTATAVQQQTNGQQAHLIEIIERQGQLLAASQPATDLPINTGSAATA